MRLLDGVQPSRSRRKKMSEGRVARAFEARDGGCGRKRDDGHAMIESRPAKWYALSERKMNGRVARYERCEMR